jgi:hypothetical protein
MKRKNLQSILISQVQIDKVNEGKLLLVKTSSDSAKINSIMFIAEDVNKDTMRFALYNTSYNNVPIGTWLIIKEPMYKLANDGINIIRIEKEEEVEFITK